jgi:DNA-binding transcriptional LysR family regulator
MDQLRGMEVLINVVDAGSFTGAGRALQMSTVMVSKHIADLEAHLSARLLNRTTRRLSLTEIGEQYLAHCRRIVQQVRDADTGAEAMRAAPRGVLKLNASVTFGAERLSPALVDYLALYPEVSVELELSNRVCDVIEEGLCAAIRIGPLTDSSLIARPLQEFKTMICASPDYLARRGTPLVPDDLVRHDCLNFLHWDTVLHWRLGSTAQITEGPASRFRSNNGSALKHAALSGMGIVMQDAIGMSEEVAQGRLVQILHEFTPPPKPMNLVYPRDRQSTPKMVTFIDFMLERFGL